MSDSDDTDLLLLVPPDFFVIYSPQCVSPIEYLSHSKESIVDSTIGDSSKYVEPVNPNIPSKVMKNEYENFSPFKYGSYHPIECTKSNNGFSPVICSDASSIEKKDNDKTSSSLKGDNLFNNNFGSCKNKVTDTLTATVNGNLSDAFKGGKITNKVNTDIENCHSPKFSLTHVDKLLNEMEKTRAEIKCKLHRNKNKIHEMRRDYMLDNDTEGNFSRNESVILPSSKKISKSEYTNECNSLKKALNADVDLLIPNEPKNLLNLSKIVSNENDFETIRQKLEAEVIKKKHCEELIQQLQSELLEHQQNMSMALTVDARKDEVICKLQQSWTGLVGHWKELEYQRQDLVRIIEQERLENTSARTNYNQRIEELENHLLEAVSLANSYREKNEKLEKNLNEIRENLIQNKHNLKLLEIEKTEVAQQVEHITKKLAYENEKLLSSESRVVDLQLQVSSLSCEKTELCEKYEDEKNLTGRLKTEIAKLKLNYTRANEAEIAALKEANGIKQEMNKLKTSLKEFYQKQLDTILRKKVDEFQRVIDKARALMQIELRKQEKVIENKLHTEINRLKEVHKLEIAGERNINQKYVNILKNELKEEKKKIHGLENRIKGDINAKKKLVELIQSALETQRLDMSNGVPEILNNFKELLLSRGGEKFVENFGFTNNDNEISDLEFKHHDQDVPVDIKKCIEMLLQREPGNLMENESTLRALLYDYKYLNDRNSLHSQKENNPRRKPPWK